MSEIRSSDLPLTVIVSALLSPCLDSQSQQVEKSVYDLMEDLKKKMTPAEAVNLEVNT